MPTLPSQPATVVVSSDKGISPKKRLGHSVRRARTIGLFFLPLIIGVEFAARWIGQTTSATEHAEGVLIGALIAFTGYALLLTVFAP